jgi:hypothetical protein
MVSQHEQSPPLVVLLTATIDPRGTPFVAVKDPAIRLAQYKQALKQWLHVPAPFSLAFCENSGYGATAIAEVARVENRFHRPIALFGLESSDGCAEFGKGHGEMDILRQWLAKREGQERYVLKVTGRLSVMNARRLILSLAGCEEDVRCELRRNLTYSDSRIFFASSGFLRDFLVPRIEEVDDVHGVYFEHVLARSVHSALAEGRKWAPLPVRPWVRGRSGSTGAAYGSSVLRESLAATFHAVRRAVISA